MGVLEEFDECRRCKMGVSDKYDGGCQEYMRVSL